MILPNTEIKYKVDPKMDPLGVHLPRSSHTDPGPNKKRKTKTNMSSPITITASWFQDGPYWRWQGFGMLKAVNEIDEALEKVGVTGEYPVIVACTTY